jgi:hypothetical protein
MLENVPPGPHQQQQRDDIDTMLTDALDALAAINMEITEEENKLKTLHLDEDSDPKPWDEPDDDDPPSEHRPILSALLGQGFSAGKLYGGILKGGMVKPTIGRTIII